jgi:hypothetical protein
VNQVDLLAFDAFVLPDLGNQGMAAAAGRWDDRVYHETVEVEFPDDQIGQAVLSQLVEK